jgi:4-diphosphocytidyl-2C-methyl-D-erythritol kinase
VLVAVETDARKESTGAVYARFDKLGGEAGFDERRRALLDAVAGCRRAADLALLPPNDLAPAASKTALPERLRSLGAFRADVSGAGPAVYGLFLTRRDAHRAARRLSRGARCWVTAPVW